MKRNILVFTLFVLLNMMATGETFRIHKTVMAEMPETGNVVVQAGINDALAIILPEDTTFFQGIELDIKIPEVLSRYYGSVAYSLYTDLTPLPTANTINYTGTREMIDTIPGRLSLNLILPLVEPNTIKKTPYNIVLPAVYSLNSAVLFFRFQLVMKGIPEDYEKEPFVRVLDAGKNPTTRNVRYSNYCDMQVYVVDGGKMLQVVSVLDNMVKGASGQAVQNMNLMFGFEETAGIDLIPAAF